MNVLFQLYLVYFKIGLFGFGGGYATIPLIEQYIVERHKWINSTNLFDIISISQMTPGPIALNIATFVGSIMGGIIGSLIATIAVISPQIIILMLSVKLINFKNKYIVYSLKGVKITVTVFILLLALKLIKKSIIINYFTFNYTSIIIFVISTILYLKNIGIIRIIITNIIFTTIYIIYLKYIVILF